MKRTKLVPKAENAKKGFHYSVTDAQISAHQKRSLLEIFEWLEQTNKFVYALQTEEERMRSREIKNA